MEDYEYISPKTTNALVLTESQGQASPWPLKVEGTQEYYKKNFVSCCVIASQVYSIPCQ